MTHRGTRLSPDRIRPRIVPARPPGDRRTVLPAPPDARRYGRKILAVWWLLFLAATLLQPPADGGNAEALSALDTVITLAAFAVLTAVTVLLYRARRGDARGGWAAFAGGLFFLGLALACPATDHHQIAGWWYGQLATSGAMAAAGLLAVRHAIRQR